MKKDKVVLNAQHFPLKLRYLEEAEEGKQHSGSILHTFGLSCNLKEIEIPIMLKSLERYLTKI